MQVGSLIFVVIVATWAAYLLQHWIRQREDAAADRSVEQFSEAMRVLEKRTPAHAGAAAGSPFVARRVAPHAHRTPAEVAPMSSSPDAGSARPDRRDAEPSRPLTRPVPVRAVSRPRRLLRGVLLLLSLLWVPASVVLAVLHILLWVSVPLAVLTVAAVLVWLRFEARADRARADRRRADRGRTESRPTSRGMRYSGGRNDDPNTSNRGTAGAGRRLTSDDTQVIPAAEPDATEVAAPVEAPAMEAAAMTEPARTGPAATEPGRAERPARREAGSAAYDFEADLARDAARAPAPQPAAEGTWSPVPVPPPTYTMKAKAEPRMTPAGVPADVFATPEFAEEAEELDERGLFARRAANL